ncbi:MAG: helix-turn-helix domain-containing protein [Pseudonocardia sp.]
MTDTNTGRVEGSGLDGLDPSSQPEASPARWRVRRRDLALRNALVKRSAGVPTYSVPEAAALMSVSQEHLYRLIHEGGFPAVPMGLSGSRQGRYVVPAQAVERLLTDTTAAGGCVEVAEWTAAGGSAPAGGVAGCR